MADTRVSIGRQVVLFIRPPLATVTSGKLLHVAINLVESSSFIVQNNELSIRSASSIPLRSFDHEDQGAR